ncbi:DNA-binding protein [Ruficoccus amylovorans]|uniref:DNA-(apurinic or apyrimidinic site) lyase n=1 Tax=Ruficoccus amylovorans TaxID=1804625 RepID=A0A842HH63_9BACT|nr:DNA glycosylase [Ruficoccus amylovorans]MBC2596075.1 DNA-binding protein [Ruficoccus amylovorans]
MKWTPWRTLPSTTRFSAPVLRELLDGGQAFRWYETGGVWQGAWGTDLARLRLSAEGMLEWSGPQTAGKRTGEALRHYLALDADWDHAMDTLPWRSDPVLAAAMKQWPGLRILRQPLAETLMVFLCSSTKQIVQIKQICADLADTFGEPLTDADGHRQLPTWEAIHAADEDRLRACRLGYRARYLKGTAAILTARPGWLDTIPALPYAQAKAELMALPGVGAKIADCVLLFGAGMLEAFPVDTWILKVMAQHYRLHGWKPDHVATFGRTHFGALAGAAQQFLFSDARLRRDS